MARALAVCLVLATMGFAGAPVTIHLAGDSTMAEKRPERRPETGWGEALQAYFPAEKVRVVNHAKNGRSTRTFIEEGLWERLLNQVRAGDYVFIQFGHNDEVPSKVDRYTPPDRYRANLIRFVADVRARHASPVLLTPVSRRKFDTAGKVVDSHREYSGIVREVAKQEGVALIDMDRASARVLELAGPDASRQLFLHLEKGAHPNYPDGIEDNTHFSPAGAAALAELAVQGIRAQKLGIAKHLADAPATAVRQRAGALLGAARIAKLPASERAAWQRYLAASDSIRAADRSAIRQELRVAGADTLVPAPTHAGFFMSDSMTAAWLASAAATELARSIISYQAPNGGWSKRIAFTRPRRSGEAFTSADNRSWLATLDNGGTVEQLRYLRARMQAAGDTIGRGAYERGVGYLVVAQMPVGCWPQIFPLAGSYHDAITFNDDVTVNALEVLAEAAKDDGALLPPETKDRAAWAVERGVACIVRTQVEVDGRRTVWGAQHDPLTLRPVRARTYEHPSLSGRESASVLDFLMSLDRPNREVIAAVHAGAAWFRANAIHGYTYGFRKDLTPQAGAGPLWARFYELGTNRPIFSDRDGVVRYDLGEVGPERRYGYMWYSDEPAGMLRRYERWARRFPLESEK